MYLLFDIGATKMRLAMSDGDRLGKTQIVSTPHNFEEGLHAIQAIASSFMSRKKTRKFTAVGGGVGGPLDAKKSMLVSSPNLPSWNGKPLKEELKKMFGVPVVLENDTAVVGLGEATFGAGKWRNIVAYVTVSTGVGGVRVVKGKIDANAMGFEPGHQIIAARAGSESDCAVCGSQGCLEGFISGRALALRFGAKPEDISDENVWREAAKLLAVGLHNTILHWSPEIVVLGGSVMQEKIPFDEVILSLKSRMKIFPKLPEVRKATLADFGGLWGAIVLLRQKTGKI